MATRFGILIAIAAYLAGPIADMLDVQKRQAQIATQFETATPRRSIGMMEIAQQLKLLAQDKFDSYLATYTY